MEGNNKHMNIPKKFAVLFSILGLAAGTAGTVALQTHAQGTTSTATMATATGQSNNQQRGTPPAAFGSVTAVSGNTITVTDKRSGTTYTVDASSATVEKMSAPSKDSISSTPPATPPTQATISVSDIAIGDNVMVQGTVSGTTITATKIMDGMMMGGPGGFRGHGPQGTNGTVSAVSGNTITLTGKDGTTYTIDAASASVKKISTVAVSDIAVGDKLQVQGQTSGTTVTATNIMDGEMGGPAGQPGQTPQ
jgi:hypothetical protein